MKNFRRIGSRLVVLPPCGVLLVYAISVVWLRSLSAADPRPRQGAMALAFLAVVASIVLMLILMIAGVCLIVFSHINSPPASAAHLRDATDPTAVES